MFTIISPDDVQVYELNTGMLKKDITYIHELIAYASLDLVENVEWNNQNAYLKTVDQFNEFSINCFLTSGRMRFIFIHENKSDDSIKKFLQDSYEYYVKV